MNSHTYDYDYLDGNAAAGELSNIFAMDVTSCGRTVCALRRNKALCRSASIHASSRRRGAVRRLRARTPSFCKSSPARVP